MLLRLDLLSLATFSLSTVWSLVELPLASAQLVNVTIDDTFGDQLTGTTITYLPPDVWKLGQDCSDCFAKLDQTKVSNGTWHDGTFSAVAENNGPANRLLTATVTFQGTQPRSLNLVTRDMIGPASASFSGGTRDWKSCFQLQTSLSIVHDRFGDILGGAILPSVVARVVYLVYTLPFASSFPLSSWEIPCYRYLWLGSQTVQCAHICTDAAEHVHIPITMLGSQKENVSWDTCREEVYQEYITSYELTPDG